MRAVAEKYLFDGGSELQHIHVHAQLWGRGWLTSTLCWGEPGNGRQAGAQEREGKQRMMFIRRGVGWASPSSPLALLAKSHLRVVVLQRN